VRALKRSFPISLKFDWALLFAPGYPQHFISLYFRSSGVIPRTISGWIAMTNAVRAEHLSTEERLDEIAEILALGFMRLKARKSSGLFAGSGESSLDCAAHQSGHANALERPGGMD
jgi:hypothetical protein